MMADYRRGGGDTHTHRGDNEECATLTSLPFNAHVHVSPEYDIIYNRLGKVCH